MDDNIANISLIYSKIIKSPLLRLQLVHALPEPIDQRFLFLLQGVLKFNFFTTELQKWRRLLLNISRITQDSGNLAH